MATTTATLFKTVIDHSKNKQPYETVVARRVCVPLATGVLAALILAIVYPPFACVPSNGISRPQLSFARIACWSLLAAAASGVLTAQGAFVSPAARSACN